MTKTGLGTDFVCNPYVGCTHGCLYCYAKFMSDYMERPEPWGAFVDIKEFPHFDIPKNTGSKSLMFCSVTDAYQPIEQKEKLTRKILENIYESRLEFHFLTKSALILRDVDLIQKMGAVEIGFSIALDDETAKIVEPGASLPSERVAALKAFHEKGIKTFVFIAPILPGITDVFGIVEKVKDYSDYIMFDSLNLKHPENRANIFKFIWKYHPDLMPLYRNTFEDQDSRFYHNLADQIREYAQKYHLDLRITYPERR
jgi:DNA repair photolyase